MQSPKIAPVTLSDEKQQEKVSIVEKALEILGVQVVVMKISQSCMRMS